MSEEIKKAYKLFNREDLIDDGYERDLDSNIQVFLTTKQMINYMDLQQKVEQLENENFNIRENIHLERISLPPELTKDKNFMELYDIPSYEDLKNKVEQLEKELNTTNDLLHKANDEVVSYCNRCIELENIRKEAKEYIYEHQLVFELSSKKKIQYWFDEFYRDLLNILNKGSK